MPQDLDDVEGVKPDGWDRINKGSAGLSAPIVQLFLSRVLLNQNNTTETTGRHNE